MQISNGTVDDKSKIQRFISDCWKHDHILSIDDDVFNHLYLDKQNNSLNFLLAKKENGELAAILGFIPDALYNDKTKLNGCWLAFWASDPKVQAVSGFQLLNRLLEKPNFDYFACLGINPATIPIYERLGFITGQIPHYFLPQQLASPTFHKDWHVEFSPKRKGSLPEKNDIGGAFLHEKYLKLNFFNYNVAYLSHGDGSQTMIVYRIYQSEHLDFDLIRIMDFKGSLHGVVAFMHSIPTSPLKGKKPITSDLFFFNSTHDLAVLQSLEIANNQQPMPVLLDPLVKEFTPRYFCLRAETADGANATVVSGSGDQFRPNVVRT